MVELNEQGRFYVGDADNRLAEIDFKRPAGKDYYVFSIWVYAKSFQAKGLHSSL